MLNLENQSTLCPKITPSSIAPRCHNPADGMIKDMEHTMNERIPPQIEPLLTTYLVSLERELPGFVTGLYIHGSIALGAFHEPSSDIDFIAVISRHVTPEDLGILKTIHRDIKQTYPRWALEGGYLQPEDMGKAEDSVAPFPYIHDGKFNAAGHFDLNDITWCVLKQHGITLLGPPAQGLPYDVDWDTLIERMGHNLNTYWKSWTKSPSKMAILLDDWGIEWAVLGVLRQYYTFREHAITSKTGAGLYALDHVPEEWHKIVREALRIRTGEGKAYYPAPPRRALIAVGLLRYVIKDCQVYIS